MTAQGLPKKLKKEPLVDAVFEIRFSSSIAASNVLPGFFFAKLKPKEWKVDSLPVAQIPSQIRNQDPNLRYQPLTRINWDNFLILVGDTVLGVAVKMPYLGWSKFRERIIKVFELLRDTEIIQTIERYSLKYVDVVEADSLDEQIQRVNLNIKVGNHILREETFSVRLEIPSDNLLNIIKIAAPATYTNKDGQIKNGILVDIDSICNFHTSDLSKLISDLPTRLDAIHDGNKKIFFDCLKPETIQYLEPIYE
jgi:uncharacterized protein (TIGR04255 family)